MSAASLKVLVVSATGGLGSTLVRTALAKGHTVSALVRSQAKFSEQFSAAEAAQVQLHVGDASDAATISAALAAADVAVSGAPADPRVAAALAAAAKTQNKKLVWTAGASNMIAQDGVSYLMPGSDFFRAHAPCIDAIKASGANFIIFCPGRMLPRGKISSPPPAILTRGDPKYNSKMQFVSYEDAAHAMLEAAARSEYDGKHIQALTLDAGEL